MTTCTAASKARPPARSQVPRKLEEGQLVDWEGCMARRMPLGVEGVRSPEQEGARRGGGCVAGYSASLIKGKPHFPSH